MQGKLVGGRYEIVRPIAEGGMGAVYEARHHMTKKAVALKILFAHIGKNEGARQRFLREVSAPATIGHEGIVEVYDSGVDPEDGTLFVAMELLKGETVREWLDRGGHARDEVLDLFDRILDPLAAAHERGIVHRDLKPENVFLHQRKGEAVVKVLDFGIARDLDAAAQSVTQTSMAMGTPHYMAPEQAMSAKSVDARADVWALGAMMYEALTGRTPFDGETASAIVVFVCTQPHAPVRSVVPDLDPAIAELIDRCLAKDPTQRPANARQMQEALRAARPGRVVSAAMPAMAISTPLTRDAQSGSLGYQTGATGPLPTPHGSYGTGAGTPPTGPMPGYGGVPGTHAGTHGAAPGAFGGVAPSGPQGPSGGFGAPAPGSFGPGGFGGPGAPGGHGTPPPGSFGPGAGHGTPPPGSFGPGHGTPPPGTFGSTPVAIPAAAGFHESRSRGPLIAAIVGGVAILIGGAVAVGFVVMRGVATELPPEVADGPTSTGPVSAGGAVTITITTPDGGGELVVDGVSQGPIATGSTVSLAPGARTLVLRRGGSPFATQQVQVVAGQPMTVDLSRATTASGGPEDIRRGRLGPGSATLSSGEFQDAYTFQWTAGQRVHLEARSTEFDTYLIVKPPSGDQMDNDDMVPGNTNAGLDVDVQQTGTWQVIVTSYRAGEVGSYELVIR
ncbi:MAG: serine/threonine protein kinase [Myxococcales bacterium]|nr:serine/threonine protein kinase [Myxococcales bacterium]